MSRRSFLTALIGAEEYAVPLSRVHEVVSLAGLTRVPTAPPFILGLVDLHGAAIPVIDLSRKFAATRPAGPGHRSILIVETRIRASATLAGIVIDTLGRVRHVAEEQVQPPPSLDSLVAVEFLTGTFRGDDGFVLCMDVDRILGSDEAAQLAELCRHQPASVVATPKVTRVPYLCVRLAGERCALALAPLREINPCGPIAWIPGAAPFVLGATNVRGAIVPVIDVARRYGLAARGPGEGTALVLVDVGGERNSVGMLVDAIEGLVHVPAHDVNTTPPFGARFPSEVVTAMAPIAGEFVPVLDTEVVLAEAHGVRTAAPGARESLPA